MTKHTPMVQLESIVYFNGGGFDLRGTPHPNELAGERRMRNEKMG